MEPQTIIDNPVPLLDGSFSQASGYATEVTGYSKNTAPVIQVDERFPTQIIARKTISESIDTQSRAIKGQYTFEQLGAIKIGEYINGTSGEVDISPNGIIGVNVNGDETFTIDGTTGDATFLGTLQAGTVVGAGGTVVTEQGGTGGRIVIYVSGVPTIIIGDPT